MLLIVINGLLVFQFIINNITYKVEGFKRVKASIDIIMESSLDNSFEEINSKLLPYNLEIVDIPLAYLEKHASKIVREKDGPKVDYYYKDKKFFHFKMRKPPRNENFERGFMPPQEHMKIFDKRRIKDVIFRDLTSEVDSQYFWFVILVIINCALIGFYLFLIKKIRPLYKLKDEIKKFADGDLLISTKTKGNDEIAQVANEFDLAIKQVRDLTNSRNLFLRNIMHELKTPITKGRLVTDTYENSERQYILIRVFQRLEYLLGEFSKIEELTSGKIVLERNDFRAIDLIEQSLDILLLDSLDVNIHHYDLMLNVDFDLFSIALKNLIDNALKYNNNGLPDIFINESSIHIRNKGTKLKKEIQEYYKPFNHDYETSDEGLGLGLYITHNIIDIHGYKLYYEYKNSYHNFYIYIK